MKTKITLLALIFSLNLFAQQDSLKKPFDIRLGVNLTSFQFTQQQDYNRLNTGGHLEITWENTAFWYGFYLNQNGNSSSYFGVVQKKKVVNDFYTGFSLSLVTNYENEKNDQVTPLPLLYFETKWGNNFYPCAVIMPSWNSGFIGLQLKFKP